MKTPLSHPLVFVGLLLSTSGCGLRPPPRPAPWIPGTYQYQSTLPGTGSVEGSIQVGTEGPVAVTSTLGPCRDPQPELYKPWNRARTFICGTDHRVNVLISGSGGPPIRGSVSNQVTVTSSYFGDSTTCERKEKTPTGEEICIAWKQELKTDRRTTGASAPFILVSSRAGPG